MCYYYYYYYYYYFVSLPTRLLMVIDFSLATCDKSLSVDYFFGFFPPLRR